MTLRGTAAQLNELREDPEFRRLIADAIMIVDGVQLTNGYCNQGVADQMAIYTEAVAKVPQAA